MLNWPLLRNPANWLIVWLMTGLAVLGITAIISATPSAQGNS